MRMVDSAAEGMAATVGTTNHEPVHCAGVQRTNVQGYAAMRCQSAFSAGGWESAHGCTPQPLRVGRPIVCSDVHLSASHTLYRRAAKCYTPSITLELVTVSWAWTHSLARLSPAGLDATRRTRYVRLTLPRSSIFVPRRAVPYAGSTRLLFTKPSSGHVQGTGDSEATEPVMLWMQLDSCSHRPHQGRP